MKTHHEGYQEARQNVAGMNEANWEKQVVAELQGYCPHCSEAAVFDVPMGNINFDEHIEVVISCGNPDCQKDFYVYMQAEAHVSDEPLTTQ